MTKPFESDYKALHAAALTLATKMLAAQTPEQSSYLERATKQGAKLYLQLGALPDCHRIDLVLCEYEGHRTVFCSLGVT